MLINKFRKWELITILSFEIHLSLFLIYNILLCIGLHNIIYTIYIQYYIHNTKDTTWTRYPTDEIFGGLPVNSDTWRRSCNCRS